MLNLYVYLKLFKQHLNMRANANQRPPKSKYEELSGLRI